jgi:ATP-dependent RNA helicase RhlB
MPTENILQVPIQRPEKPEFLTQIRFETFDLLREIQTGLIDAGFLHCTPIQAQVLPISLSGQDIAGQAQTGTGKTAAFLVTVFARLLGLVRRMPELPSALIVAPTRELALQIYQDAKLLGRHTGLSLVQVVGGVDYQKQAKARSLMRLIDFWILVLKKTCDTYCVSFRIIAKDNRCFFQQPFLIE